MCAMRGSQALVSPVSRWYVRAPGPARAGPRGGGGRSGRLAVEGEKAAGILPENLALRALPEPAHVLAQLLHRPREDRIPVRVVRGPAHVVLADVIDYRGDGGLVRVARDHALTAEDGDRVVLEPRHFLGSLLPVFVHAVEPEGQP